MATEFARSPSVGLSCVGRNVGMLSEIHTKTVQHCRTAPVKSSAFTVFVAQSR